MYNELDLVLLAKKISDKACNYANKGLKEYNITHKQFIFMMYMYNHSNSTITLKELSESFELSHVTVIGLVKRLEKSGFIVSMINPDDKRSRIVMLKQKGIELCNKIVVPTDVVDKNMVKVLGAEKTNTLKSIMNDIYINFDKIFVEQNPKEE